MAKMYVILLKNHYLLFADKKPKKKGNYTNEVRLFETSNKTICQDIYVWADKGHKLPALKEVKDWE